MDSIYEHLRSATRAAILGRKPVWFPHATTSADELQRVTETLRQPLPDQLVSFLLEFGFGDIGDEFSFRQSWFTCLNDGPLSGHLVFGQDDRGNFYTVEPASGAVHFLSRSGAGHCQLASSFLEFLRAAQLNGYMVATWAESLELHPNQSAA